MRPLWITAVALSIALAGPANTASFIYSYKETDKDPKTWRVCLGRLEEGRLTTSEAFSTDEVRMFYSFVGAAGHHAVISRHGEGIAECIDLRTMKREVVDSDFARAVCISDRQMIYLAEDSGSETVPSAAILKRYLFADARSERICAEKILTRIPFPAVDDPTKPISVFWGVFLVDGKRLIGNVDLNTGGFTRAAELDASEQVLCADVSENGQWVLLGVEDTESSVPPTGVRAIAARIRLVDTRSGESRVLVRSVYQAVPAASGLPPRFAAVFAGNDHVLYPETVLDGSGGISFQRLMSLELSTRTTVSTAVIEGGQRLVNAVPVRAPDGMIEWAEYQIHPDSRKAEPLDRYRARPFRVDDTGDLVVGGKKIGRVGRPASVWSRDGVVAFVGRVEEDDSPGLHIYCDGMERPVRVNPDPSVVQTFGFLDTP